MLINCSLSVPITFFLTFLFCLKCSLSVTNILFFSTYILVLVTPAPIKKKKHHCLILFLCKNLIESMALLHGYFTYTEPMKLFYTVWALDIFVRANIQDSKIIFFKLLNNNHTFCWRYYFFIKYCPSNCKASTGINSKDCCPVQKDNNVLMSSRLFLNIHGAEDT